MLCACDDADSLSSAKAFLNRADESVSQKDPLRNVHDCQVVILNG